MVYMHDVAHVHNGNAVQTNIVTSDGNRSVLLSVFKETALPRHSTSSVASRRCCKSSSLRCGRTRHQADRRSVGIRAGLDQRVIREA